MEEGTKKQTRGQFKSRSGSVCPEEKLLVKYVIVEEVIPVYVCVLERAGGREKQEGEKEKERARERE